MRRKNWNKEMIIKENWAIKEEFNIWRNNIKFMYDLMIIKALEWPYLTIQWLLERDESGRIMSSRSSFWGHICSRARYMPQTPNMIATKLVNPNVYVFDISKHPTEADLMLTGHTAEGFSLSWSNFKHGHLLSEIHAEDGVQDVAWHLKTKHIFGLVCEDKYMHICDVRKPANIVSTQSILAHKNAVTNLAFNPHNEWIEAIDGPAELLFIHIGQTSIISYFWWSFSEDCMVASVAKDNVLQIWEMDDHIYSGEEDKEDENNVSKKEEAA
ncbi:hypothetical protein UlMin_019309 [Ulmus minor]